MLELSPMRTSASVADVSRVSGVVDATGRALHKMTWDVEVVVVVVAESCRAGQVGPAFVLPLPEHVTGAR